MADENALIIVTQQRNKERVDFPNGNYSLKLSKLKKNDSGAYRAEIHSSSIQSPLTQDYELRVYEQLSKPKVTIDLQNSTNGTCITNLTCSMEQGGEDVTYSWKSLGQTTNESHSGSVLPISWRGEKRDMTFICMARNPISSNSSTPIFAWKLCEEFIEEKREIDPRLEILNYYPPSGETLEYDTIPDLNVDTPYEAGTARMEQLPKGMILELRILLGSWSWILQSGKNANNKRPGRDEEMGGQQDSEGIMVSPGDQFYRS
ncbi:SLAM family member 7-like protein [Camelus ferus]|nr:SLAM family member 7-like protein [Camelus ferus]